MDYTILGEEVERVVKEPEAGPERVEVQLRTIEGKTGVLAAHCEDSLLKLKMRIAQLWNIPEAQQKLVANDTEVLNDLSRASLHRRLEQLFAKAPKPLSLTLTVIQRQPDEAMVLHTLLNAGHLLRYEMDSSFTHFSAWVPRALRGSHDVLRCVAHLNIEWLRFANAEVRKDPKFFYDLLEDGVKGAFPFAAEELQNDRAFVLKTVSHDSRAFESINRSWLADREIALAAVCSRGKNLELLGPELQNDKELVLVATQNDPCVLRYASASLCADPGFIGEAVSVSAEALRYASINLREDPKFLLSLLEQNSAAARTIFGAAGQVLHRDLDFVIKAASINPVVLQVLDSDLTSEMDFLLDIAAATRAYEHLRCHLSAWKEEPHFALDLIARDAAFLEHVGRKLRFDRSFVLKAVKRNPAALDYATFALRSDEEVQAAAKAPASSEEHGGAKRQRCT